MKILFSQTQACASLLMLAGLTWGGLSVAHATPETAIPADAFVDSFGVNIKLSYTDTPYGDFAKVKQTLLDSGMRHVRTDPKEVAKLNELAASGIRFTCLMQPSRAGMSEKEWQDEILSSLRPIQSSLVAIEGPNEPDGGYIRELKPFPDAMISYQKLLYQTVKADAQLKRLPVIVPSIAFPPNSVKVPNQPGDLGNTHSYHGARPPETDEVNLDLSKFYLGNAAIEAPGKTVICTETGNRTNQEDDPNLWMPRISEWSQAKYALRTFCYYYAQGIPRTFVHELVDEHPVANVAEANFGLLRNDWSPKPAYTGIRNLLHLLNDPAPAQPSKPWKPEALDFELTGDTANVRHLLLQKRDGTFYLVLWQAVKSYDFERKLDIGVADAAVTLTSRTPLSHALIYSPLGFAGAGAALRVQDNLKLGVPDYPIVVELIPRGPDLVVTGFSTVEPAIAGKPVRFKATLKNQGTAKTPAGTILSVTFFDKTQGARTMLTYSSTFKSSLSAGAQVEVVSDGQWTPKTSGDFSIEAQADDADRVAETSEANNSLIQTVRVAPQP